MCLTVSKFSKEIKAEDNYFVYKVVGKDLRSSVQHFQYQLGKTYKQEFGTIAFGRDYKSYGDGFHYYKNLRTALTHLYYGQVILECVVPKGALYINSDLYNVGVANRLVTVRTLTLGQARIKLRKSNK